MKPIFVLSVLVFGIGDGLFAQQRSVTYPAFEFRATSIYEIEKIELSAAETRVHVLCRFIPGWWVNFSSETFIRPSGSEDRLLISGMVGGTIGQQITMPASGDSAVVLVFPPVPANTLAIDLAEDGKPVIFGLSLDRSTQPTAAAKPLPNAVQRWIDQALADSQVKEPVVYGTDAFFSRDTARLVGYINGYDPRAGFSTGMIYAGNDLTRESYPVVVDVYDDGRFEARIPMQHPIHTYVAFERRVIPFYIEPGQTLSMLLDWDDFLEADRKRNRRYEFGQLSFGGPLARINDELRQWAIPYPDHQVLGEKQRTMTPADFKRAHMPVWEEATASLAARLAQQELLPQTEALLRAELMVSHASYLFDFLMSRNYYAQQDTANAVLKAPVSDDYHDFLANMPLDNPLLLATRDFSTFINRFEYCDAFKSAYIATPQPVTPGQREKTQWQIKDSLLRSEIGLENSFAYEVTKVRSLSFTFEKQLAGEKDQARVFLTELENGISHPFLLAEAERLFHEAYPDKPKQAYELPEGRGTTVFKQLTNPHKGKYVFVDFWATTCGPCVASIEHHKQTREQYRNHPDFDFVFITSTNESPQQAYENFIAEQELTHTHRLSADDFRLLRQLFKFNGIPRYVVIDPDGRVLNDDFPMHNFKFELDRILASRGSG